MIKELRTTIEIEGVDVEVSIEYSGGEHTPAIIRQDPNDSSPAENEDVIIESLMVRCSVEDWWHDSSFLIPMFNTKLLEIISEYGE